jgi:hypothetical protein
MRVELIPGAELAVPVTPAQRLRVCVELDKGNLLRWHGWLIDALRALYDVEVSFGATEDAVRMPLACRLAFEIERLFYRIPPGAAVDRIEASSIVSPIVSEPNRAFDAVINIAGGGGRAKAARILKILFDGAPGEIGALGALFDGRPISIAIEDSASPGQYLTALPALADRKVMTLVFDNACSIAIDLVIKALEKPPSHVLLGSPPYRRVTGRHLSAGALAHLASSLMWKANRFIAFQLAGHEQWSVAVRQTGGRSLLEGGRAEFAILPDDGRRYFADPFVLRHEGRTFLFMEEFPFETGLGRIAVASIEDDGRVSSPRPVLEEGRHFSYPNVFVHGGEVWMVPESGGDSCLDLYRAVEFPFVWRREARLLENVHIYDATFLHNETGWWMFAATLRGRATGWDCLSLFHADDLRGPWRPCAQSPAVLDASAARPAGAMISSYGAAPVRPVQDCAAFYGAAIGLWRVDSLKRDGFEQTQVARIAAGAFGIHTYNATNGFEVVDLFGRTRGVGAAAVTCEWIGSHRYGEEGEA